MTLLGFVLPDDEFEELLLRDAGMPVQTQQFGLSLVKAVRAGGATVSLLSAAPATTFPNNPRRRFSTRRIAAGGAPGLELGFVNLPFLKHLTRLISVFRRGPVEVEGRADVLVIHGVHSPWLAFGLYSSRRLGIPAVAVMTDPPSGHHQFDNCLTRKIKGLDRLLVTSLLGRLDGVIALTQALAEDFAPSLPILIVEGITPNNPVPVGLPTRSPVGPIPTVVYAGGLSEPYGVRLLLDAHAIDPRAFRLRIAGRGPLEVMVRQRATSQANLEYLGLVPPAELAGLYAEADVLVNPRPPGQGFTRYSFPSKLLEYLAAGRPVVSTRLEGIPAEYDDVLVWAEPTSDGLRATLDELLDLPAHERARIGEMCADFACGRSAYAWGPHIVAFLELVRGRRL